MPYQHTQEVINVNDKWICTRCNRTLDVGDVFILWHAGPHYSHKPLWEPCADINLAEYRASWTAEQRRELEALHGSVV